MKEDAQPDPQPQLSEDLAATLIAAFILATTFCLVVAWPVESFYIRQWIVKPATWGSSVLQSLWSDDSNQLPGLVIVGCTLAVLFGSAASLRDTRWSAFWIGFGGVFFLATLAFVLASQEVVKYWGLSYALWALLLGLLVSNTVGTPRWLSAAVQTELYIKTGLVLLGAEVLMGKLLSLGMPGVCIAWIVTPVVLVTTFWFGQRVLKIDSPSLNMVVSADMSVCGVSAAIATAAACRARREELSIAIGLSLTFTVIMMVVMPAIIRGVGLDPIIGGAWMGGTIDATGAVAAAGAMLGDEALLVATTIKMIQNILIGVVAFCVATYWVAFQSTATARRDRDGSDDALAAAEQKTPGWSEVWRRFPKFVLGFLAMSAIFSALHAYHPQGADWVSRVIRGSSKTLRGWCFCLAFVSIGLETNFRELRRHFRGGKPLILYVVGQTLNVCLTLLMAWLMFKKVFPGAADALRNQ